MSNETRMGINYTELRLNEFSSTPQIRFDWAHALNIGDPNIALAWLLLIVTIAVLMYIFLKVVFDKKNPKPDVKEEHIKKRGKRS